MATGAVRLVEQISDLYLNEKLSDATIAVDNVEFPAHRVILAQRCRYFELMFNSNMIEATSKRIEIRETSIDAVKAILKWIYTGTLALDSFGNAVEVLCLARMYELTEVVDSAVRYFKDNCTVNSVCLILNEAVLHSLHSLTIFAIEFVADKSDEVLKHGSFERLSTDAINVMLTRGVCAASKRDVFHAVAGWMKANPSKSPVFPDVMKNVPLNTITLVDLVALPSDVLDANVVADQARQEQISGCFKNENVAVPKYGVKVIAGGDTSFFDEHATGILEHMIGTSEDGIVIDLGRLFRLNFFKMQLPDIDQKNFSYRIAVSEDNVNWIRAIDHSKYLCRSLQKLYFEPRPVRFIRICGTAPVDGVFQLSRFEASYTTEPFEVDPETTLLVPPDNVSLVKKNAIVVQGTCFSDNAIIDGTFHGYTGYNGYTRHRIEEPGIIVQLPQPYLLDSLLLLLWDGDNRVYSYNIEVSVDQANWTRVFSEERVSSWREVHFEKQPVVFVKITGTDNSVNDCFHCVHLECFAKKSA